MKYEKRVYCMIFAEGITTEENKWTKGKLVQIENTEKKERETCVLYDFAEGITIEENK